jgi:hypothetical protein
MVLQLGNWVETESGTVGKVVHISRLTVFVAFDEAGNQRVEAFLESQLTKIDCLDSCRASFPCGLGAAQRR